MNRNLYFQREALLQLARQHRYPLQVVRLALARGFSPARIRDLIEQAVAARPKRRLLLPPAGSGAGARPDAALASPLGLRRRLQTLWQALLHGRTVDPQRP
jgi:hypothetical protein